MNRLAVFLVSAATLTLSCKKEIQQDPPKPAITAAIVMQAFIPDYSWPMTKALMNPADTSNVWANELCGDKNGVFQNLADTNNIFYDSVNVASGNSLVNNWTYSGAQTNGIPGHRIVIRGLGGSRAETTTTLLEYIAYPQTKNFITYFGENELNLGRTPQQMFDAVKAHILEYRSRVPHVVVIAIGQQLSPLYNHKKTEIQQYNTLLKDWIATQPRMYFVDMYKATTDSNGDVRPELFNTSNVHMWHGGEGYAIWNATVKPYLDRSVPFPYQDTAATPPPVGAPIADAGADQTQNLSYILSSGYMPVLNASLSHDVPPGWLQPGYQWAQVGGDSVTIVPYTAAKIKLTGFTTKGTYTFRVTVVDNSGLSASDDVNVIIK